MEEPRRLGGRYELGGVLGRGGMAEVYIGHDIRLGRAVAVKTLRADMARDPSFQARFRREAQSAASLNHPSIVAVYDTGEDYIDGISIPYIVMEYVEGSTLRELLHSGRRLLPERAMEMTIGVLQALEYSHRNGIVHRDIKPANVMLTRTGQVKVMDFGIARAMGEQGMTMTQTAAVIGTAQYLSPEQALGEQVDARSDLYSTGCLLYELLTVRPPFIGDSPVAVAYQHVREEPQPPSVYDPEVRPEYDAIVLRALAKDRDYRYQSADEMRADIERALDGLPVAAAAAPTMAFGMGGYPQQTDQYGRTTAMPQQGQPGATSILPGSGQPYDAGGDGYGSASTYGEGGGRSDRRRAANGGGGRKGRNQSVIWLVVAAVVVLVGAFLVGKMMLGSKTNDTTTAPSLISQSVADARTQLENLNQKITLVQGAPVACDESIATKGQICTQSPRAGTVIKPDSTITVHVSSGAPTFAVPNVKGLTQDDADAKLQQAGFVPGPPTTKASSTVDQGKVISYSPTSKQAKGATIDLVISSGPQQWTVPANLVGMDLNTLENQLNQNNIKYTTNVAPQNNASIPDGSVVGLQLSDGSSANPSQAIPQGSTVVIVTNPPNPNTQSQPAGSPSSQAPGDTTDGGDNGQQNGGNNGGNNNGGNNGFPGLTGQ